MKRIQKNLLYFKRKINILAKIIKVHFTALSLKSEKMRLIVILIKQKLE